MRRLKPLLASAALFACWGVTAGVGGCSTASSSSTITVTGRTLTIYGSFPSSIPSAERADMLDAEQLALKRAGSSVGRFTVKFVTLTARPSDNARTAIQDQSAIAYLGEIEPGASADSIGINEDQDLLQVSPTDTAIALTSSTPAVPGAPKSYYEAFGTYGRTFARVVPSALAEARAQVEQMRALGVRKLYVADDGTDYGKAIAYAVRHDAPAVGIDPVPGAASASGFSSSGAGALFYGASPSSAASAGRLFLTVAQSSPSVKLFAPSSLHSSAFAASLGPAHPNLYVSEPGFLPRDLPAAAQSEFVKPFETAYGHAPDTEAIFGYEAMAAVLSVLHQAGAQAGKRSTVVRDFFHIKDRASVLGTYSINADGDTSIAPFVFSRLRKGVLVPYTFVQPAP